MSKGYAEGPAAEEAERRREEREHGVAAEEHPESRLAVYGSTPKHPERHFIGWVGEVDPDRLFDSGAAWGVSIVRRRADLPGPV
jgi:hypothetical protein